MAEIIVNGVNTTLLSVEVAIIETMYSPCGEANHKPKSASKRLHPPHRRSKGPRTPYVTKVSKSQSQTNILLHTRSAFSRRLYVDGTSSGSSTCDQN